MGKTTVTKDTANKAIRVERHFDASRDLVWQAWTENDLLDQWWAPKPWQTRTEVFEFKEGGYWLYAMVGPDGETHWCRADFKSIDPGQGFQAIDTFCDEQGNINTDLPEMNWSVQFQEAGAGTRLIVEITFKNESDLENLLKMGFEEGFTSALDNLDQLLAS